jgi:hypothetical protein
MIVLFKKAFPIAIYGLCLLTYACGQSTPHKEQPQSPQTVATVDKKDSNASAQSTTLDSIERANNESVTASGENITKAYVSASDKSITLSANMRQDHRVFGYEQPNVFSKRLLLLSVFTDDVENNPFECPLGAYYDTNGMDNANLSLKYVEKTGDFVKAVATDKTNKATIVYFEKKWIAFE